MTTRKSAPTMLNPAPMSAGNEPQTKLESALNQLANIVSDAVAHGFFEIRISGEIGKNQRRELLIQAGTSHKFIIPVEELPLG